MRKLYEFFKSVKLAVVLIIIIAVTSIIATLIPQGKDLAFYYHTYPQWLVWVILRAQLNTFFRSFIFITTAVLFLINLSVCTVDRLVREIKGRRRRRYGPDMIHIGLLIVIVGSLVTFLGRKEGFMYMAAGDEIRLPGGYVVELESFEFFTYQDGSPKDWISTVSVFKNNEMIVDSFQVEVNKPLNVGKIDIYQSSYARESRAVLLDASGKRTPISEGKVLRTESAHYLLTGIGPDPDSNGKLAAYFEKWQDSERTDLVVLSVDSEIDGYVVKEIGAYDVTGLQAVIDPGFVPALIGLILCGVGLSVTYLQKIGDKEI